MSMTTTSTMSSTRTRPRTRDDDEEDEDDSDDVNRIPAATARAVLDFLVRALVDDPDSVEVDAVEGRRGVSLG